MSRRFPGLLLVAAMAAGALLAGGCEGLLSMGRSDTAADTTRAPGVPPPGEGLVTGTTGRSVAAVTEQLKSAIQASPATLVADVNHAQNASGDSLRPTRLLMFGNPALGTPLMQGVQTAGIDLPQKMLVWEGRDDSTRITYNVPAYLATRHDFEGVGGSLRQMGDALASLAEQAAGRVPDTSAFNADSIRAGAGLAIETSDFGPGKTYRRLREAVRSRPPLSVMAQMDHAQNAPAGDSLRPTRLLVFGNPRAGTPLMRKAPTMGIDLPQKMLVWEGNEGNAFVAYNEPAYLARRHQLADTTGLARPARTLDRLAQEAASNQAEVQRRRDTTGMGY
ncbi:MAG: hypothetical protein BRD48_03845 [Bacteroidetes bacterium QS_9_68_14]|nr:MAG: hypothetical protein BRD48_03845 [Bacteroidetes bacterium QS_9_68_14]